MICRQCGRYLPDDSRFCPGCGTTVQIAPQYPVPPQPPVYQPVYQHVPQQDTNGQPLEQPDSPHLVALKKLAGSPMMLIAVIGYTLGIFGSLINAIAINYDLSQLINYLFVYFGDTINYYVGSENIASTIINLIPTALISLGLWLTYGSARKKKGMSTAGINIIKVLSIIFLVGICIISAVWVFAYFIVAVTSQSTESVAVFAIALVIVGAIIAAAIVFAIVLQARIIGSLNAAAGVINTGRPTKKVSVFLALVLIFSAVGSLFAGICLMSMGGLLPEIKNLISQVPELEQFPVDMLSASLGETLLVMGIPCLISAVTNFLFALLIFRYRANVQKLVVAPPAPVEAYEPYPYAPAAPVVEEAPAEVAAAEEIPAEAPSVEEAPTEEPAAEEIPAEAPVAEEAPVEEPVVEVAPVVEEAPSAEETLVEAPAPAPVVEELPAFIYCIECGQKLVATAKFCSRCGHPQK